MPANAAKIQRGKPFTKGVSGNPAGKKPGTLNKATAAAQCFLDGEAESLTRKAVELALAGNVQALLFCVARLIPPRKERALTVRLPRVVAASDLPKLTAALLAAVGKGELTAAEASSLSALAANHCRALEITELERRLAVLEKKA